MVGCWGFGVFFGFSGYKKTMVLKERFFWFFLSLLCSAKPDGVTVRSACEARVFSCSGVQRWAGALF